MNDKNPFGAYVAHRQVSQIFYNNEIRIKKNKLSYGLNENYDTASLYINISKNFFLNQEDINMLLKYLHNGNSIFISSENIDSNFLNTIGFPQKQSHSSFADFINQMKYTAVQLQPAYYYDTSLFSYYYVPLDNYFNRGKDPLLKVLGTNENGQPNFVLLFYGKGRIYLHCEPRVFSNYFLLQKENYKYLESVFSFAPAAPQYVFWDDYYNKRNTAPSERGDKSGIAVLLKYPAMAWAYWLVLLLLVLYVIFGSKRRQRIIKPIAPNENTSVAFTETVGRLYLQKKDNRNIADKIITYFFEHIRNQYFLNSNQMNEEFISTLSRKSNVPREDTEILVRLILKIQRYTAVSDQELLSLNQQIEKFYKHKK